MLKRTILTSIFLASIPSSCKKKSLEQRTEKIQQIQTTTPISSPKETITHMESDSFTLSCGSGCAVTYTAEEISQDKGFIKVRFNVDNHMDDELVGTSQETYLFYYNNSGGIDKIINEETRRNILEEYIPAAQETFREFAASLIKDKKIDIPQSTGKGNMSSKEYKLSVLPFDHEDYYSTCYVKSNEAECKGRYPQYPYPENKDILQEYGIKDTPTSFFMLPKIHGFQPIILAYTESDVEGYYLKVATKDKLISSLQIAEFDGETVNDFIITKNFEIELYTRKNTTDKRILKRKYKIQQDGTIK